MLCAMFSEPNKNNDLAKMASNNHTMLHTLRYIFTLSGVTEGLRFSEFCSGR